MASEFERKHHDLLAQVIEHALRSGSRPILVPELAERAGFSRFHLARLFQEVTQERLEGFLRRIRLERAAYMLQTSPMSVQEVALAGGYESPEAFSRAFRAMFGLSPSQFRADPSRPWKLPSPTDLHWNEHWGTGREDQLAERFPFKTEFRPALQAAVWRWTGNYSKLADGWSELEAIVERPASAVFITLYHDNMWTHPKTTTMRADLGWLITASKPTPAGMRRIDIPAGMYAVSNLLKRTDRNDAWSSVGARWPRNKLSMDEYPTWPLPFEQVKTRIVVGA